MGGQDIDNALIKFFVDDFKKQFGLDLSSNNKAIAKLKKAAKESKESLSAEGVFDWSVSVECLDGNKDYEYELSRTEFEEICESIFEKILVPINDALLTANL